MTRVILRTGKIIDSSAMGAWMENDFLGGRCVPLADLPRPDDDSPLIDNQWRTQDVVGLAHAIEAEAAFDLLPILADALEEAGCDDARVLAHCRGPGPHIEDCWVIEAIRAGAAEPTSEDPPLPPDVIRAIRAQWRSNSVSASAKRAWDRIIAAFAVVILGILILGAGKELIRLVSKIIA